MTDKEKSDRMHRYGVIDYHVTDAAEAEDATQVNADANQVEEVPEPAPQQEEMTEEQRKLALQTYKEEHEKVLTLQEECHLGKVTDFCRLSDLHNPRFKAQSPSHQAQQEKLVQFCEAACQAYHANGLFDKEQAEAVVYAFITAANNNLYPTEESEAFFGIELPTLESLLKGCSLTDDTKTQQLDRDERVQFEESTFGLLVWRTWKILIRTPEGRSILLAELLAQCDSEEERECMLNSYSAVEAVLVECLITDTVRAKFIQCVQNLPVSHVMQKKCLMPRERKFLLDSFQQGEPVEWLHSVKKGHWTNLQAADTKVIKKE